MKRGGSVGALRDGQQCAHAQLAQVRLRAGQLS